MNERNPQHSGCWPRSEVFGRTQLAIVTRSDPAPGFWLSRSALKRTRPADRPRRGVEGISWEPGSAANHRQRPAEARPGPPGVAKTYGGTSPRPTAVVADDEFHVVELIAMLLETLGVQVVKAYDGEQALQAVLELRPRLLITDVVMPKLRGDELARRIKQHPETADVRVVILSSQPRECVTDTPVDAFIPKPFDLNYIEKVLVEHLGFA